MEVGEVVFSFSSSEKGRKLEHLVHSAVSKKIVQGQPSAYKITVYIHGEKTLPPEHDRIINAIY